MKIRLLTICGIIGVSAIASQAQASNYLVKSGDTLYTIAKEHGTSVQQLKVLNTLKDGKVTPGQRIKITTEDYYRVKKGDTVQSIATHFNITPFEVRFWNRLSSNELVVGKEIIISEETYRKERRSHRKSRHIAPALSPENAQLVRSLYQDTDEKSALKRHAMQITLDESAEKAIPQQQEVEAENNDITYINDPEDTMMNVTALSPSTDDDEAKSTVLNKVNNNVAAVANQMAKGKIYVYGANSNHAVDCSSFAQKVLAALGKSIPRTTYAQMAAGTKVTVPEPGDLVFFNEGSHVGVYIGNGKMVDALNPTEGVGQRAVNYVSGTITGYYRF